MIGSHLPGLAAVAAVTLVAYLLNAAASSLSPLIWAIVVGIAVAAVVPLPAALRPGIGFASRRLLRVGVALLGLRLAISQVIAVGPAGLLIAFTVVVTVVLATLWLGRRLGVGSGLSLLIATGSAICGASAIVAVDAVIDTDDDDVGFAVATVTLFGTVALLALPLVERTWLHLPAAAYGTWAGASVHEVAQVIAAAAPVGPAAVKVATVVKLTRVLLLAPFVLVVSLLTRRAAPGRRRSPIPFFVIAFAGCVAVANLNVLPATVLAAASNLDVVLLTLALAGLGLGVRLADILRLGWRPMALGLGAWLVAGAVALAGVTVLYR